MEKQVLLINDMAGYGKVALSAMIPVLSHFGVNIYNLPTALVSNTLDYGKFEILDTTDYMQNTLKVWETLNFNFKAIATGFIVNEKQANLISEYCSKQDDDVLIFTDPIMGDDGKLYNGMSIETVKNMRKLCSVADYILPNITEAAFLVDEKYQDDFTLDEIRNIIDKLRDLGSKNVVITSICVNGEYMVAGYDSANDKYFNIPYVNIPVRFPGTGDIFSAIFIGNILNGKELEVSVKKAMDITKQLIELSIDNKDKYNGIQVESYLEVLNNE